MLLVYHAFLIFRKNQLPKGSEMQTEILVDNTNSEVDSLWIDFFVLLIYGRHFKLLEFILLRRYNFDIVLILSVTSVVWKQLYLS